MGVNAGALSAERGSALFYLAPLQDKRGPKEIWTGRGSTERVIMEPAGATLLAKAWHQRPYSDMSYLFHRQLAYELASAGYGVVAAQEPFIDDGAALVAAHLAGAQYLVKGSLKRLDMVKRGADAFLGTDFSGNNYLLNLELQLQVVQVENAQTISDQALSYQRLFYDPTRLGSDASDTFPRYFAMGLPELALRVADEGKLRAIGGLPTLTPTMTPAATAEARPPQPGDAPAPLPTAAPAAGPYWANPKTGKVVDPSWNFDPSDGTPRDKFVLHPADPVPTPTRAPEPK